MKRIFLTFALLGAISTAASGQWVDLFNGKNLRGWKMAKGCNGDAEFVVKDGAIVGTSRMNTPNSFLKADKEYGDFILEYEFYVDNGLNSGVQFRSTYDLDIKNGRVHGYQCEIDPSARAWSAGVYDEANRGWLYSLKDSPKAQQAFKAEAWNKVRIEAIGDVIKTYLNGVPCVNLLDNGKSSGVIALQVHGIGKEELSGKQVKWRNIRICTQNLESEVLNPTEPAVQISTIPNVLSSDQIAQGWELLWDGKTTKGWRGARLDKFPEKGWVMEDDCLIILASDGGESTNAGDIVTEKEYTNFELKVDFKITKGANSGIKYFVDTEVNKGAGSAIGCEFQILDDKRHEDANKGVNGNRRTGSLYDLITANPDKKFYMDEFNTAHIIVKGNHVEHWLNGEKVVEYDRNTQMFNALVAYSKYRNWPNFGNAKSGRILLQDHGNRVMFQNVMIKVLP